jgi:hypothetical protein
MVGPEDVHGSVGFGQKIKKPTLRRKDDMSLSKHDIQRKDYGEHPIFSEEEMLPLLQKLA